MASIIYAPINTFFGETIKDYKSLVDDKNFQILVISKDIIADVVKEDGLNLNSSTHYESRYKHIDFLPSLFPTSAVMEFMYGSSIESFAQAYRGQLKELNCMEDLCCVVDMVIKDDTNIIILMSNSEYLMKFTDILQEVVYELFRIKIYNYEDFKVEPESIFDIGDKDEISKMLEFHIENSNLKSSITGEFMNDLYSDMKTKYEESLMSRDVNDLVKLAAARGIYVNKHKPKSDIVDHIMKSILKS